MDYRALFRNAAQRPGMYGLDGTDATAGAFVSGVDTASGGLALAGFTEWLQVRVGRVSSLAYPGLVAETGNDLFTCLDEFLAERDRADGMARIYHAYFELRRSEGLPDIRV